MSSLIAETKSDAAPFKAAQPDAAQPDAAPARPAPPGSPVPGTPESGTPESGSPLPAPLSPAREPRYLSPAWSQRQRDLVSPHRHAIVALAIPAAVWAFWVAWPTDESFAFVLLPTAVACAAHVVIDLRTKRLQDLVTLVAFGVYGVVVAKWYTLLAAMVLISGFFAGLDAMFLGSPDISDIAGINWPGPPERAIAGAVVLYGAFWVLHRLNRGGLGLGDVKLAALLGFPAGWLGWTMVAWVGLLGLALGGLYAGVLLVTRRAHRTTTFAFGPWLIAGFVVALSGWRLLG